jgi:hypothetical protein
MSKVTLTLCADKDRRLTWVRKDEDYVAEFCLISGRTLDEFEIQHLSLSLPTWSRLERGCRQLKIDRGTFFHPVYRIQQKKLGRVFRELKLYGPYPLDEYFGGTVRKGPSPPGA